MIDFSQIAVVIPVFNPEPNLVRFCGELVRRFSTVVVVDDGSVENQDDFERLPDAVVRLAHDRNRGKGRTIKTALEYLVGKRQEIRAAVFADGDGQHAIDDVESVAAEVIENDEVTFGVRDLGFSTVPLRSWWGNWWTALEVRLLFGLRISDTQTGLRGVPSRFFEELLRLPGERFEFEARIFRFVAKRGEQIRQVQIKTIYIENNRASHFRPLADTWRTQLALWRG